LELRLPAGLAETAWDTIFVDGPAGFDDDSPGRMKSICTAAALARRHGRGEVIVHDCDREVERRCCDRFFFAAELVTAFDRTRHYRIQPDDL
jgi:glucuronoxylan 4-O-methyltransferase